MTWPKTIGIVRVVCSNAVTVAVLLAKNSVGLLFSQFQGKRCELSARDPPPSDRQSRSIMPLDPAQFV